ncbi:MAG: 2-oxo-4-hydroxy-4-carboxy-5-ureidoimidazoline decarboxylase [Phycisphaerae bacterium]|nr:2-oxo-4-hydroxy-4-carboxy-5-ureidoimidazoline decarboxylase [Phycisphaerae bacterium]MDW8262997.1 2-oxo-4-hydroxy-4-carboxy-5-ureidoimidazoline decarboxylase [Phycisphaerales bacterium]
MALSLLSLNAMDCPAFVDAIGTVFEHSPWVARKTWPLRPFASLDDLHQKLCRTVAAAGADRQLSLLRAHPDLVGRLARRGRLTRESTAEQAAAGLDQLSEQEIALFDRYNREYRERFGFPFIICARLNRKEAILQAFPRRLQNPREREISLALEEVYKIARLRLEDRLTEA